MVTMRPKTVAAVISIVELSPFPFTGPGIISRLVALSVGKLWMC
jgi:hypothetical protein